MYPSTPVDACSNDTPFEYCGRRVNSGAHNNINENGGMVVSSSPLMCEISHGYLSIATEYIRHWIKTAVLGHVELYSNVAARVCCKDCNKDVEDLFEHAICRIIIQFRSTSERLNILSHCALHIIEEDCSLGVSWKTMNERMKVKILRLLFH